MFFRRKLSGRTQYLQIVKNERVDGKPRQSVVATLGRVDRNSPRMAPSTGCCAQAPALPTASAVVLTAYERATPPGW